MKNLLKKYWVWLVALAMLVLGVSTRVLAESSDAASKARKLYQLLTGVVLTQENPLRASIEAKVSAGDLMGAAQIITHPKTGAREFYDSTIQNFAMPFNRAESGASDPSDLTAMFVGNTRDEQPIDNLLFEDMVYTDPTVVDGNIYTPNSNAHFRFLETRGSLRDSLVKRTNDGYPGAGIFTTRGWGEQFFLMGTNRRNWEYAVRLLYCTPLASVKSFDLVDSYIRRDVPRVNGGDPNVFVKDCKGCHSTMDAVVPAFLQYDFDNGRVVRRGAVVDKLNEINYPSFRVTTDEWNLLLSEEQNRVFGFQGPFSGNGLQALGQAIAGSSGFINCMAKRVVSQVYLRKTFSLTALSENDQKRLLREDAVVKKLATSLASHRSLKRLFEEAVLEYLR